MSDKLSDANFTRSRAESERDEAVEQNILLKRLMDKAKIDLDKLKKREAGFDGEVA